MTKNRIKCVLSGVTVAACLAIAQATSAAQINATLGFVPSGGTTFTGSSLGSATSVTVPASELVNTIPTLYNGLPNDFLGFVSLGSFVTLSTLTLVPGGSETLTFDGFTVTLTGLTFVTVDPTHLGISAFGSVSGNGFTSTPAELSASFDVPAIGGAVNGSFTLSAPPPPTVPETTGFLVSLAPLGLLLGSRLIRLK